MNLQDITDFINNKINQNENIIVYTFYEVRVKLNLTEEEAGEFLRLSKIRLENLHYNVYFTGAKFVYENVNRIVQDNELMIAIKSND